MKTVIDEVELIKDILSRLPKSALHEVRDFAASHADRERRHKELVARVLKAEQEPDTIECKSFEEFMQAIEQAEIDSDNKA